MNHKRQTYIFRDEELMVIQGELKTSHQFLAEGATTQKVLVTLESHLDYHLGLLAIVGLTHDIQFIPKNKELTFTSKERYLLFRFEANLSKSFSRKIMRPCLEVVLPNNTNTNVHIIVLKEGTELKPRRVAAQLLTNKSAYSFVYGW